MPRADRHKQPKRLTKTQERRQLTLLAKAGFTGVEQWLWHGRKRLQAELLGFTRNSSHLTSLE